MSQFSLVLHNPNPKLNHYSSMHALLLATAQSPRYLSQFKQKFSDGLLTSIEDARDIMGDGFISIEEVSFGMGLKDHLFSAGDSVSLGSVCFSRKCLEEHADSHDLFPGFPVSPVILAEAGFPVRGPLLVKCPHGKSSPHVCGPLPLRMHLGARWYLISKDPVAGSERMSFRQQVSASDESDMAHARELAFYFCLRDRIRQPVPDMRRIRTRDQCGDVPSGKPGVVCVGTFNGGVRIFTALGTKLGYPMFESVRPFV